MSGCTIEEHLQNLEDILYRLHLSLLSSSSRGISAVFSKARWNTWDTEWIRMRGIHTSQTKVKTILNVRTSQNLIELLSFLDLLHQILAQPLISSPSTLSALKEGSYVCVGRKTVNMPFNQQSSLSLTEAPVLAHYNPL